MGDISRSDFSLGWYPSADGVNAPKNALLRADNLVLDEVGAVALRQGSSKINPSALADTDVHSLSAITLGAKRRIWGAGSTVYDNAASILTNINGSEDIQFGSHMGNVLIARGTTKKKYDGTTVRNWGIAAPNAAPVLNAITADFKVFASCDSGESPGMTQNEGTQTFTADRNGIANAAVQIVPDTTTGRGTSTLTFTNPTNFTIYTGGATATDADLLDFYCYITEPQYVDTVTIMIDVNDGTFQQDWYSYTFSPGFFTPTQPDPTDFLNAIYSAEGFSRDEALAKLQAAVATGSQFRADKPVSNAGWNHFQVPRGSLVRSGGTTGKDWSTVKAIRVTFVGIAGGTGAAVRFDQIQIIGGNTASGAGPAFSYTQSFETTYFPTPFEINGPFEFTSAGDSTFALSTDNGPADHTYQWEQVQGYIDSYTPGTSPPLTGTFAAAIVACRNDGTYVGLSGPSAFSNPIELTVQGVQAIIPQSVTAALDTQVNELRLYMMGGSSDVATDAFYLFGKNTNGPFSGSVIIANTESIQTAMIADITMETDNGLPPDNIIGIEGPHYDRTLCLTSQYIYPSRELNPDSFASGEVLRVGDATETALWLKRVNEQVYVGTTRDVYRIDGDWTPLPDGTLNITKHPLGVFPCPVGGPAVTVGSISSGFGIGYSQILIYLTSNGWQILGSGKLTDSAVDLLWKGYNRFGVTFANVVDPNARFRCAIANGTFFAITPESPSTTSSSVIHAYNFSKQRWYRFVYPQAFRSIYTEPDGTIVAGDSSGFVRLLNLATKQDDGANIPITLWTPIDDNGAPFTNKVIENYRLVADTGGATANVAFHLNGNDSPSGSVSLALNATDVGSQNVTTIPSFRQVQQRITGNFSAFVLRGFDLTYLDAPDSRLVWDTNFPDVGSQALAWLRFCRVKAQTTDNLTVTAYLDGIATRSKTITATPAGVPYVFEVGFEREAKGRQPRVVVTSPTPFPMWWIELQYNESGQVREKRIQRFPVAS